MRSIINKFYNPWDDVTKRPDRPNDTPQYESIFKKGQEHLSNLIKKKKGGSNGGDNNDYNIFDDFTKKTPIFTALAIFILWIVSGVYTLQPDEEGVVMRFGSYNRTTGPGLNYRLPKPIEQVTKISATRVNKEEIGFRSAGKRITTREQLLQSTVSTESQMLTTDENIVDINFEIQWQISDSKDYLFNVRDLPNENTVKFVAESAMRETIGLTRISDVLAEERNKIEQNARLLMQGMVDNYKMGVKVLRVQLLRVDPPQEVIDAYRDVQNAKQDKEREINKALAYRNDVIPRARGEAAKITQEAEGYKQTVIARAIGDSKRFDNIYKQYKGAKEVTRRRMYLEALEEILTMDKIIIDKNASSNLLPYLPLGEIKKEGQKNE